MTIELAGQYVLPEMSSGYFELDFRGLTPNNETGQWRSRFSLQRPARGCHAGSGRTSGGFWWRQRRKGTGARQFRPL